MLLKTFEEMQVIYMALGRNDVTRESTVDMRRTCSLLGDVEVVWESSGYYTE